MTKGIYNFRFIILILVCFFCKGQENSILNKPFSLESYSDKISKNETFIILESKILKKIFKENSKYFIQKGWQKIEQSNNTITELIASDKANLLKIKPHTNTRYLFVVQNDILKDTLRIKKEFDYSICQLDKENKKHGLAIGKYKINDRNEFFEIHYLYQINNNGKLEIIKLDTNIFDCPAPSDYVKDEEPDSYKFGIVGGKKFTRYWFENH
ncbi:hypothetical protein [Chryseobacterium balustinum]|nr:hypothetical protein [Chryseobacterium balustinum]